MQVLRSWLEVSIEGQLQGRITSRISGRAPHLRRTIADLDTGVTVGRVHFMVIRLAECGCKATQNYIAGSLTVPAVGWWQIFDVWRQLLLKSMNFWSITNVRGAAPGYPVRTS
jgi:hypothetical protein